MHPVARLPDEWKESLAARSERPFRAQQIFKWIHARGVLDPRAMTDLARAAARVAHRGRARRGGARSSSVHRSTDATRKVLLRMARRRGHRDGAHPGEQGQRGRCGCASVDVDAEEEEGRARARARVRGPGRCEPGSGDRVTQCISTQVGCAMGCVFCASGVAGLKRHLGAHEIVAQVHSRASACSTEAGRAAQRRAHGDGRAAAQLRSDRARASPADAPDGHQLVAAPHHREHLGARSGDRAAGAGFRGANRARHLAPRGRRRDAHAAHADQQEVPARPSSWRRSAPIRFPSAGGSSSSTRWWPARTTISTRPRRSRASCATCRSRSTSSR